jgi:hypothetical protein
VDSRHLEGVIGLEQRQDPRQSSCEHRLPRPRRPAEEDVVPARCGQLERAARPLLPADVCEVGPGSGAVPVRRQRRLGPQLELAAQVRNGLGKVADRNGDDTCEGSFAGRVGRTEKARDAKPPRTLGDRQDAADAPQAAVERELADRGRLLERAPRQLLRRGEKRQRDRQVEPRALLPQLGRCEVDRDPSGGEAQLGGGDAAADALASLLASAIGEADDREARDALADVGLDGRPGAARGRRAHA